MSIGRDGQLRELYELASRLAETYGWQLGQATTFMLTGNIPLYSKACVSGPGWRCLEVEGYGVQPINGLARIQLKLEPLLSPREVADIYAKGKEKDS